MAIDRLANSTAQADDDLDVPDFLKPDYSDHQNPKTIPGEIIPSVEDDTDDDAPLSVVEYRPARPPVLAKTGSAAMVVASRTGRVVGLSARAAKVWGGWFGHGAKASAVLAHRYVRAHDHQEALGGMTSGTDWNRVHETRRKRWGIIGWWAAGIGAADLISWAALAHYEHMTALDAFLPAPTAEALAAIVGLTVYGRYRLSANVPAGQVIDPEDIDDGTEPYPLAWCTSGDQVEECVSRALAAEGISVRDVNVSSRRDWGWELDVELKGSTPGKVVGIADQLEAHLALPHGGFMIEPDPRDASRITVRLVQSNPFADMPRPPVHTPRSLSVHDVVSMGRAMDGSTFELTFDGFCALVIGAMGAGKTLGALRTIAEALTACVDAVCWDLDPLKGGLGEFGDLMEVRARGPEECEEALERALAYVTGRSKVMPRLGMGDRWEASETHPHLFIFIDEYLQLSPRGKDLAIKVLRTGRQYGVYLVMAGQEATADALGDAIAQIVAYRILMACRFEDVRIAFGPGKGAQGWRPDRMEPSVGKLVNDAGQSFIMGGGFVRAIRYRFNAYTREQILRAVPARVAAGVTRMDADTLLEAGQGLASADQRISLADRLDTLAAQGGLEDARLVAVLLREFELSGETFLPTSEVLLPAVHGAGFAEIDSEKLGRVLRKHAPGAKSTRDEYEGVDGRPRGWARAAIEQAAAGLIDPVRTRSQAA